MYPPPCTESVTARFEGMKVAVAKRKFVYNQFYANTTQICVNVTLYFVIFHVT